MKIIYLSDFNCPYSYIGLNRIMEVCNELSLDVNWEMKSFELEPKLTEVADACERYAIRNNTTPDNAKSEIEEIEEIAKSEGLNMNYMDLKLANSKDAHRLVKYCERRHPQTTQEIIADGFEFLSCMASRNKLAILSDQSCLSFNSDKYCNSRSRWARQT